MGNTPERILEYILGGFGLEINDRTPVQFNCNCTKSRVEKALISVGKKDIQEMIEDGKPIEVNCHFCGRHDEFSTHDLEDILERAR